MVTVTVTRKSQSFVVPSEPAPAETLELSAIDRVPGLRHTVRSLHVFRHGKDTAVRHDAADAGPAEVIRAALSRALVDYRPFAGRFVGSLMAGEACVACTDEGAWFVEATADCSLDDVNGLDYPLMVSEEDLLPTPEEGVDPTSIPVMMQGSGMCGARQFKGSRCAGTGARRLIREQIARGWPRATRRGESCRLALARRIVLTWS